MADILTGFHTAENKIIILGPVVLRPHHACPFDDRPFHHQQMADVIHRAQKIRIVIRLKMGLKELISVHGHFIFVRIDDLRLRLFIQFLYTAKQRVRRQHIVMVGKSDPLSRGRLYGRIGILRNFQTLLVKYHADTFILLLVPLQCLLQRRIPAAAVGKAELPVGIGLIFHRLDQLCQIGLWRTVQRHHDTDLWMYRKFHLPLARQLRCRGKVFGQPLIIGNRSFSKPGDLPGRLHHQRLYAVGSHIPPALFQQPARLAGQDHAALHIDGINRLGIGGAKYQIDHLRLHIGQFQIKSAFGIDLCFPEHLRHIHPVISLNLTGNSFPVFVIDPYDRRFFPGDPAPYLKRLGRRTGFFFLDIVKRFSLPLLQIGCRNRKPENPFIAVYGEYFQLFSVFQRRQTQGHRHLFPPHHIQIRKPLQSAGIFPVLQRHFHHRLIVQPDVRLIVFGPAALQNVDIRIQQVEPFSFHFK